MAKPRKRLFLDDDPERAAVFLRDHPDAVWVQTVPECLEKLAQTWDEVHLDHDLGGEVFVELDRDDCGMEVVRWLAKEPRRHLKKARFTVHSHNMMAAYTMVMQIRSMGFRVQAQPFGLPAPEVEPPGSGGLRRPWDRLRDFVRRLRGLEPPARTEMILDEPDEGTP